MNTYSEQIFQSIDTIISQRLNEVSFDKTEICKIVSQNKDYPERYWVTNEAGLKYEAYSVDENKKYFEGQKIYVTVPQGNYELRKLIIGTYSADEIPKGLYTNPFDHLVVGREIAMDGNIVAISNNTKYDDWEDIGENGSPNYAELDASNLFPYKPFKDYDYLGLEFAFQTDFNKYQGSYALRIVLCGNNGTELLENNNLIISSKDLYGNPYRLNNTLVFQHLFPWPMVNEKPLESNLIKSIKVQLIQDNGFYYSQGEDEDDDSGKEIVLSKAIFKFGYDIDNIKEDKLTLVPKEGQELKYTSGKKSPKTELFLEWVNIDKEANIYSFNSTSSQEEILKHFKDYTVIWLHYVDGIGNSKSQGLSNDIAWNWEVIDNKRNFTKTIKPITFYNNDQYKVVIKYTYKNDETTYYAVSNAIIFENTLAAPAPGGASASGESLRLVLLEGNTGVYNIYGLDGKCVDTSYLGPHSITFEFLDGMTEDWIEDINWVFPETSTMIVSENSNKTTRSTTYKIKSTYNQGAMNNRIQCQIKLKNGEIRTGSLTLQFGEATTGGTNYSLNLDFVGNATCIHPGETVEIKIEFAKANGEEVQTPPQFACGWVGMEEEIDLSAGNVTSLKNSHNISIISYNNQNQTLTLKAERNDMPQDNYSFLYVTAKDYKIDNGLTVDLTAYLPIPIANVGLHHISGATRIVYSMDTKTYSGSKEGYYLYDDNNTVIDKVYWTLSDNSVEGAPQLRGEIINEKYNSGCSLRPVCYTVDEIPQVCIIAYDDNSNALWSQPILIMSNKWQSEAINNWDGSVTINDEEGSIKAPFFIAGKKVLKTNDKGETTNVLSGVVIGDLYAAKTSSFIETGIHGFEEGILRYALTDAGSFYVGTGSENFISFNENVEGRSSKDELFIKTNKFTLQTGKRTKDSEGSIIYDKYLYLSNIKNEDGAFFQFNDKVLFKDGTATIGGWNIDKKALSYNSGDLYFGITNDATLNNTFDTISYPKVALKLGDSFGVTSSGTVYANSLILGKDLKIPEGNLELKGTLELINGKISVTDLDGSKTIINGGAIESGTLSIDCIKPNTSTNATITFKGNITCWNLTATGGYIGGMYLKDDGLYYSESGKRILGMDAIANVYVDLIDVPGSFTASGTQTSTTTGGSLSGLWKYKTNKADAWYEIATMYEINDVKTVFGNAFTDLEQRVSALEKNNS